MFASERTTSFVDELASAAGKDPVDYLRELLGPPRILDLKALGVVVDYPNYGVDQLAPGIADQYPIDIARLRGVVDLVAANSSWGQKLPPRQGRGIAVHRSFLSYVAVVAHVAVGNDGQVTIPRLDMAIDCGLVVNPDRVRAQLEGAAIMSVGNALYSQITVKNGSVEQATTQITSSRASTSRRRPTSISLKTRIYRAVSANRACRRPHPQFATRSTQQPANALGRCRSMRSS